MTRTLARAAGVVVVVVIVLSLAGRAQVAGLIAMPVLLIALLVGLVRGSRPSSGRPARSLRGLARYRAVDRPQEIPGMVLAGLALWNVVVLVHGEGIALPVAALLVIAPLYARFDELMAGVLGAAGTVALLVGAFTVDPACDEPLSTAGKAMLVVVFLLAASTVVVVRAGVVGFIPRPGGRVSAAPLLLFGLLDASFFLVDPAGIDIWAANPPVAFIVVPVAVVVVAVLAAFAPGAVLALVALGAAAAEAYLAAVEAGMIGSQVEGCRPATGGIAFTVAFVALVLVVNSLFGGGGRSRATERR